MAFQPICAEVDLPSGERKIVTLGRTSLGVFNIDGRYFAVRNVCPHHGAEVCLGEVGGTMLPSAVGEYEFGLDGLVLQCPRHAWHFSLETGRAIHDPEGYRCRVYPVKVEAGQVLVDV